jgi:hypothetical protein
MLKRKDRTNKKSQNAKRKRRREKTAKKRTDR